MSVEPTEQDVKALADLVEAHESLPGEPLWRCACGWEPDAVWHEDLARCDLYLNHVSREMLAALPETDALAQARAEAWDEAVQALAWAQDNGPDPLRYVAEHNPHRAALRGDA